MAVNGIDTSGAASYIKKDSSDTTTSSLDKDAFLQLLVTQMQNQDPLEPTDNTQYMSQLAQFSQLEAMNNLNSSYSNSQAMNLVGQYVILNVTDAAGNVSQKGGLVEYVTMSNGDALLHVNGEYYSMNDVDSVVDYEYVNYIQSQNGGTTDSGNATDDKTNGTIDTTETDKA